MSTIDYGDFETVASDDEVKTDLELTCMRCGGVVCDVEAGDDLHTLVGVATDHLTTCPRKDQP